MNFGKAWLVTKKDLLIMRKRKSILALMFVLPLLLSIGLPSLIDYLIIRKSPPVSEITELLGSFAYFFLQIVWGINSSYGSLQNSYSVANTLGFIQIVRVEEYCPSLFLQIQD